MGLAYWDLQLLPPPACVPDGKWVAWINRNKITLRLTRQPEHAVVGGVCVPELVASASYVIEGGFSSDRKQRSTEVRHQINIMATEIVDWVEFAAEIGDALHIDVQVEQIEVK